MMPWYRWGALALLLALFGCSAQFDYPEEIEKPRHVTLYSGGKIVREWHGVTGVLLDPVQFKDPATGERVTLTGAVAVEADK